MNARRVLKVGSAILLAGVLGASCGGSGGGGGDGGGDVSGFKFNDANMETAAATGTSLVDFFPAVGRFALVMVDAVPSAAAKRLSASRMSDPMDMEMCWSGSSMMTWDDTDNNSEISAGDALTLTLTNCDMTGEGSKATGSAEFTFTSVAPSLAADVVLDLDIADTVDGKPETETIGGSFPMQVALGVDPVYQYTVTYGGKSRSDVLTQTLNGKEQKFGCFDVSHKFSPMDDTEEILVRGIANVAGKIMQVGTYFGDNFMTFDASAGDGGEPVGGSLWLLSFDGRPNVGLAPCNAVGSPGQVDSDDSSLLLTATGGGNITLGLYLNGNNQIPTKTIETTWGALTQ
ncbi:MAG: hypothetical protein HZB55_20240 [Deltaproteobacteria bacterium]|nr:hypothetical protein [Deltaproteobacteria bacterium]